MTLSKEQIEQFEKHRKWLEFASKCEHTKEHEIVSIPSLLSKCDLTDDACRYENCPKRKEQKQP